MERVLDWKPSLLHLPWWLRCLPVHCDTSCLLYHPRLWDAVFTVAVSHCFWLLLLKVAAILYTYWRAFCISNMSPTYPYCPCVFINFLISLSRMLIEKLNASRPRTGLPGYLLNAFFQFHSDFLLNAVLHSFSASCIHCWVSSWPNFLACL